MIKSFLLGVFRLAIKLYIFCSLWSVTLNLLLHGLLLFGSQMGLHSIDNGLHHRIDALELVDALMFVQMVAESDLLGIVGLVELDSLRVPLVRNLLNLVLNPQQVVPAALHILLVSHFGLASTPRGFPRL